ncbi:MAG: DUF3489 domain-containing protein [Paracoccaceae bacterium]
MTQSQTTETAAATKTATPAKRETRRDQLIKMLRRKAGADVPAISEKMGWQPHSTRAALTGLRKAGFTLEATKPDKGGPTRYRIVNEPAQAAA